MTERWAQKLSLAKLEQIKERLGLTELHGANGGPFRPILSARDESEIGETRILVGDGLVKKVVYHAITVDFIGLDSHMIFAFTDPESPVPHWTFDSVLNDPTYAFHLDLLPRVDLGSHRKYMEYVFGPLDEAYVEGKNHAGVSDAALGPIQRSIMSAWMLAYRVTAEEYPDMEQYVQRYLDRWYDLVDNGFPQDVIDSIKDTDIPARDRANRGMIFNREIDNVWNLIGPLVGDVQSEMLRSQLETNEIIESVPADFTIAR